MRLIHLFLPLAAAALLLQLLVTVQVQPAGATTEATFFFVTTAADEDDGTCAPNDCSIREAINAANANPGADIVMMGEFDSGAGLYLEMGQLVIEDDLTLFCGGIPFNAGGNNRYFDIKTGTTISMNTCSIQGGSEIAAGGGIRATSADLTLVDSYVGSNASSGSQGGGIASINGSLTLIRTTVANNMAELTGGGIYGQNSVVTLRDGSLINFNQSNRDGGGISISRGSLEMASGSSIQNNGAVEKGGGIFVFSATVALESALVVDNTAGFGGGIYSNGSLTVGGMISGFLPIYGEINDNTATNDGGGIFNAGGTVTMQAWSRVAGNTAEDGGGIYSVAGGSVTMLPDSIVQKNVAGMAGRGGGIFTGDPDSTFDINGGSIRSNLAALGAGIYNTGGKVSLSDECLVQNNQASSSGGGLYAAQGQVQIKRCIIFGNIAGFGGGNLFFSQGRATVSQSRIIGGLAQTGSGGGIYASGPLTLTRSSVSLSRAVRGGGLYVSGDSTIINSTIELNEAAPAAGSGLNAYGGAIYLYDSDLTVTNTTIVSNTAERGSVYYALDDFGPADATLSFANTIIAYNYQNFNGLHCWLDTGVTLQAVDLFNLSDGHTCTGFRPGTALLGDREVDFTWFYPPLPGSDAIDAGSDTVCTAVGNVDQRGAQRPFGAGCDVGAIEYGAFPITHLYLPVIRE